MDKVNLPLISVTVPVVVPFTRTVTPGKGNPLASLTVPEISFFWGCCCTDASVNSIGTSFPFLSITALCAISYSSLVPFRQRSRVFSRLAFSISILETITSLMSSGL